MIILRDIETVLQRNFIDYTREDLKDLRDLLKEYDLRIEDILFQIDSADTVDDAKELLGDLKE